MRFALWLIGLFGVAVAIALFAGSNPGTVTLFWPPYRIDLSLNLVLLLLFGAFLVVHLALKAIAALLALPDEAQQWHAQQLERRLQRAVLDALSHLNAGRFARARRSARAALAMLPPASRDGTGGALLPLQAARLRSLSHWLLAESAHALGEPAARDEQLTLALAASPERATHDALLLGAARWALDDGEAGTALARLDALAPGAARRVAARRLRLRAWRGARLALAAFGAARTLARHRALPRAAAAEEDFMHRLALDAIAHTTDAAQLHALVEQRLTPCERAQPRIAIAAAQRLRALGGAPAQVREWLLPAWEPLFAPEDGGSAESDAERVRFVRLLDPNSGAARGAGDERADALHAAWRERIDAGFARRPDDPLLQYVSGIAKIGDPAARAGEAAALLERAARGLRDAALRRSASRALARLGRERGASDAAAKPDARRHAAEPATAAQTQAAGAAARR